MSIDISIIYSVSVIFEMIWNSLVLFTLMIGGVLSYKVTHLKSPNVTTGISPFWDACTESFYYADFNGDPYSIYRYDLKKDEFYYAHIPGVTASFIIPVKCSKNKFLVGSQGSVKIIKWNGKSRQAKVVGTLFYTTCRKNRSTNHMNDGGTDPKGRLYTGECKADLCNPATPANASVYFYNRRYGVTTIIRKELRIVNAPVFNEDARKGYLGGACNLQMFGYDWDPKTGDLENKRIAFDFAKNGIPSNAIANGYTIDVNGYVYSCINQASQIWQIDPETSTLKQKIEIPTPGVIGAAWGGCNLDILFVTTGGSAVSFSTGALSGIPNDPLAGQNFLVTDLGQGTPSARASI